MTDLKDEIYSDDFPAYRMKEIAGAAEFIITALNHGKSPEYISGALDMFRKILNFPGEAARTEEQRKFIGRRLKEDFAKFEMAYIRRAIHED